jgi:hypothetical protein
MSAGLTLLLARGWPSYDEIACNLVVDGAFRGRMPKWTSVCCFARSRSNPKLSVNKGDISMFSHSSSPTSAHVRLSRLLCTLPGFMILPALFAAGGPPPTTVQGVVEVLNDALYQPYNESRQISATSTSNQVSFDVPEGKRLVIESISIRALVTTGSTQQIDAQFSSAGGSASLDIPVQFQGVSGATDVFKAALPLKIRVDGTSATAELFFSYTRTGPGISTLRVSIYGYLVDITQ